MSAQKNHDYTPHLRGDYERPGDVASQTISVGDAITPFVPLFATVTTVLNQILQIYENAKCNEKICAALLDRVEIAQMAVKSLQRKYQANEKKFRNQDYYYAWIRFVNVLENIRKFAKEITQLTIFQKFINANAVKDAFEKNIKEFEEVCSDLNFTMAMYNAAQKEMEAKNVAEDLDILAKSMDYMKDEIKAELRLAITEVTTLLSNANVLGSQINDAQNKGGEIFMDKTGPLIEEYKAPKVVPNELQEPYSSDDNVRGTNKTVRKKIYRGMDVACKKVQLVKPDYEPTKNLDKAINKQQQINLAALLKLGVCPFIINFYGVSTIDNSEVMIYDWAAYGNLSAVYLKFEIDWPTKLRFARDIFNGLVFMHQCNLYHHDVRCENILVTDKFEPKISNFELSRAITGVSSEIKILADIIRWLAPEKMRKSPKGSTQRYNHNCEMYSFGMMLWELCHQRFPYKDMDVGEIQDHVLRKKREVLEHTLSPSPIQKELYKLIKRAWEDDPSARPSDIEMQQKLKDLFQEHVFNKGVSLNIPSKKVYGEVSNFDLSSNFQDKVSIDPQNFYKQYEAPDDRDDRDDLSLDNFTIPIIQPLIPFVDGIKAHKTKDYKTAWECFESHAKLGNNMAKYWQGYYLLNGTGVPKNHEYALKLFKEAADAGVPDAQLRYAFALLENKNDLNVPEILKYMTMAADSENSTALFNLGDIYWNGKLGVPIDKIKAGSYIKLAALKNQPKAIQFLDKIKAEKAKNKIDHNNSVHHNKSTNSDPYDLNSKGISPQISSKKIDPSDNPSLELSSEEKEIKNVAENFETLKKPMNDMKDEIKDEIKDVIKDEIKDEIKDVIKDEIKDEIKDKIKDEIKDEIRIAINEVTTRTLMTSANYQGSQIAWEDEHSTRPSDMEMQQKFKDLFDEHVVSKGISTQIRPKKVDSSDMPNLELSSDKMNHNNSVHHEKSTNLNFYEPGYNYQYGIGVEKDKYKSFIYYQKFAEMGNDNGMFQVGYCYLNGIGIEKDEHKAFIYFKKSAEMRNADGTCGVGYCYQNGIGVEKNEHRAFIYYQKSADMGNACGTNMVGNCYRNGIGVEKDEHIAFMYYQKSAEMGNASGICSVGYCYEKGIGIEKDEHKAFIYYRKSAERGHAGGFNMVGYCYEKGIGVEKNVYKAFVYYQMSADMGHSDGAENVGYCYLEGRGTIKDEKNAFKYFKKSADLGSVGGILQVGDCYRNGIGVLRDIQRANHWYRIERGIRKINKSSHEDIEDNLKKILDVENYQLSWIPYNEFQNIQKIGAGGFSCVYRAYWFDKNGGFWTPVALKLIHDSNKCNQEFVNELKKHCEIRCENPSFLRCYGISKDDHSKDYMIVLEYANKGSLRDNLCLVAQMEWKDKLSLLYCIASDLESIHSQELIHSDLHSGNILHNRNLNSAYITDLGLTISSEMKHKGEINGIIPYIAPEILNGRSFTQAADIYSFGVIMSEISTGKKAFDGETFDYDLCSEICLGKRPGFDKGTPDCYIKLAKRCLNKDPNKRPTATVIGGKICHWLDEMNQDDDNEIKRQFLEADKIKINIEPSKHPNDVYTRKLINIQEMTKRLSAKIPYEL